jgi:SAM-dependent methyltransferase
MEQTAENIAGNHYNKYATKNPIACLLVNGFLKTFDRLAAYSNPQSIYEIGCGEGVLSRRLAENGYKVHGTDIDADIVEVARENNAGGTENVSLSFAVQSIYELKPGSLSSFDLVVCCEVFEHLPDPRRALDVLYESGAKQALLSVPREPLWRVMNMARFKYLKDLGNTPGHLNHWSSCAFKDFVGKRFVIEKVSQPIPWTFLYVRRDHAREV